MGMFKTLCECVKGKKKDGEEVRDEEGEMGKEYSGINKMNPYNNLAISDSDTILLLIDIDRVMERGFVSLLSLLFKVNQVSS